ncbi:MULTISPECIES: DUF4373 domain-containing protein [Parabacteroides]|jgi:FtsZ-binding cell division protein ZapB|uniref:DUF4373 domain-containing protein n=3 Tax=Parabacteroides goldsteinii TaxID=328812 RepID=A0A6G1Z810_9BACT|nr:MULTISPECIES: DUF4373 domain-containing protein [Parabacteroides]EOS16004.1 hypothetical protein C803_04318 [Parabacteroides goldsteinii dnLKV18]KAI4363292.1 hypothetical protein C825_005410 [Parabacteroides sp. ASF519]MBF0765986.1 DUF4373 domain-containing protein [Parabacteroides goldsteinii]MDZ3926154.1 DUF4373 domain-containing protein [Parabacteroides goldsteinii]MRX90505.1 DUF4373 domain-containing protein [Parabacteroides goldsteinii]
MARPIKKGLDYFPVDTDIFENIQVRKLKSRYKSLGFLAYFTILCDVYKKEGYFLHISDDYVYDLADRLGDTEEKIQERYILVVKRCKNPISEEFNCINIVENAVNVSETGVSVTEMRQRKEKESKVNIQQQQHACEEPKEEPQNLDEERERWKDALRELSAFYLPDNGISIFYQCSRVIIYFQNTDGVPLVEVACL